MKPRAFIERARRIVDRLSERIDDQAMRKGADALHCVAIVGAFHEAAGRIERTLAGGKTYRPQVMFAMLRALHRMAANHRSLVGA